MSIEYDDDMFDLEDEDKQIATGIYQEKTETKPNKNK